MTFSIASTAQIDRHGRPSRVGGVGTVGGQIAKQLGCRAVGIAGGEAKTRYLAEELRFDAAAVDYKAGSLHEGLRAACPDRIDV